MSSEGAAITALAGRGDTVVKGHEDYRIVLPQLPSGEAMKRAVVLHGDMACRPYRIEDFRKPLGDAGVLGEVARFGALQMSHVWLLDLRTDEAKKKLLDAGRLVVKGRQCIVIDPYRQELRVKLHWVSFGVTDDAIHREFTKYGEVKEVAHERWRVPGFDGVESTTRIVRLVLREGVALDRLPHQLRLGGGMVLVVVPGRAPVCLRCNKTGHIRRDCQATRCTECRAYGHERDDCVRSYARAAGRKANEEHADHIMDEDEAEEVAAPMGAPTEEVKANDASGTAATGVSASTARMPPTAASVAPRSDAPQQVECQEEASSENDIPGTTQSPVEVSTDQEMPVQAGSVKRSLEDGANAMDATGQELRLRQLERKWKVVVGGKGRGQQPPRDSDKLSK